MVIPKGYPIQRHVTISNGYKLVTFRMPYGAGGPDVSHDDDDDKAGRGRECADTNILYLYFVCVPMSLSMCCAMSDTFTLRSQEPTGSALH